MSRFGRIAVLAALGAILWGAVRHHSAVLRSRPNADRKASGVANFGPLISMIESTIEEDSARVKARAPFDPPLTADEIRDAVEQAIRHVLTEPDFLADARDSYGAPGATVAILVNDGPPDWPAGLNLDVKGWRLRMAPSGPGQFQQDGDHVLGIVLASLDVRGQATNSLFDGNIQLNLCNVGGPGDGAIIGACGVYFVIEREQGRVVAKCTGALDP